MKLISKQQLEEKASVEGTDQDSASEKKKRERENGEIHVISLMASGGKRQSLCRSAGKDRTDSSVLLHRSRR